MAGIEPYGAQRELVLLSQVDDAGLPRINPMPRASVLWRIRGELDVARLTRALRQAAAAQDAWWIRFTASADGPRLIADPAPAPLPVTYVDAHGEALYDVLSKALYATLDLRRDPLATATLVRTGSADHVLFLVVDHGAADGVTLTNFLRRIVARYRDPDGVHPPVPSFLAHAAAAVIDPQRPASREFWSSAMTRPVPPVHFPGGTWKDWSDCDATRATPVVFDQPLLADLWGGTRLTGASAPALLLAATAFLTGLWAAEPVPVLHARSGRSRRAWLAVPGPLHEAVISVPPVFPQPHRPPTLADWVRAHATTNMASPPLLGHWLTDFGGIDALRRRRRIVLNVQSRLRTFSLGTATIGPAEDELRSGIRPPGGHPGFPARNALHLAVRWSSRSATMTVFRDPDVVPDAEPVLGALRGFARLLATCPDIAAERAGDLLRERWYADTTAAV